MQDATQDRGWATEDRPLRNPATWIVSLLDPIDITFCLTLTLTLIAAMFLGLVVAMDDALRYRCARV